MNLRLPTLLLLVVAFDASSVCQAADPTAGDAVSSGQQLVAKNGCSLCHQVEGQGGQTAKPLSTYADAPDSEIKAALLDPKTALGRTTKMQSYQGKLSDAELLQVTAYIKAQRKP